MSSKDTAYSNVGLDIHTDTNYFSEPVALEMFHLLEHDGEGGESQLVDGFRAAYELWDAHPKQYERLATMKMFFHSSGNEGLNIQPHAATPTLVHDEYTKVLKQVRWNNADRGAILSTATNGPNKIRDWYEAMR